MYVVFGCGGGSGCGSCGGGFLVVVVAVVVVAVVVVNVVVLCISLTIMKVNDLQSFVCSLIVCFACCGDHGI